MNTDTSSYFFHSSLFSWQYRFKPTPTNAARPIPDSENSPHANTAPPMPIVRVSETIMILRVRLKSIQLLTRLAIPGASDRTE